MKSFDIVITSFNGRSLLKKHLPNVIKFSKGVGQIVIVDDGGNDDTAQFLEANYPQVTYLKNQTNLGFTKSTNRGVALCNSDLVVLLNNDVSPQKDYLKSSIRHFADPKVFAVTFNEIHSSWPDVSWGNGKIHFTRGEDKSKPHFSAWASGGSCIINRKIWNTIGGMDEIYSPGYWEDIDIGWRAWKMGYKIIWDPKSTVDHQHESTFKTLNPNYLNLIKQRNELLFHWKNISDRELIKSHQKFLITHTLKHPGYLKVIISALKKLPRLRKTTKITTDKKIFESVNSEA